MLCAMLSWFFVVTAGAPATLLTFTSICRVPKYCRPAVNRLARSNSGAVTSQRSSVE